MTATATPQSGPSATAFPRGPSPRARAAAKRRPRSFTEARALPAREGRRSDGGRTWCSGPLGAITLWGRVHVILRPFGYLLEQRRGDDLGFPRVEDDLEEHVRWDPTDHPADGEEVRVLDVIALANVPKAR